MEKNENGKQYHLFYNVKAVGKNIKCGRGVEDEHFRGENQDLKIWGWGRISNCRKLYTPLLALFRVRGVLRVPA